MAPIAKTKRKTAEIPERAGFAIVVQLLGPIEVATAIVVSAVTIFLLVVRATHAGALWRDECGALQLARMSGFHDIASNFQHEAFPLLFPIAVRFFTDLAGTSDSSIRAFGFLVGFAMLGASWWNARMLRTVPLLLPALLGFNTTWITSGASLRGYGIGCAAILFVLACMIAFLQKAAVIRAIGLLITCLISVQLLSNNLVLVGAIAIGGAIIFLKRRQFRPAAITAAVAALSAISVLPYFRVFLEANWTILLKHPGRVDWLWQRLIAAFGEPRAFAPGIWLSVAFAALLAGVWHSARKARREDDPKREIVLFLVVALAASIAGYYGFLRILSYATQPWYYLPLLCFIAASIDLILAGVAAAGNLAIRLCRICLAIVFIFILPSAGWSRITARQSNIDIVADKVHRSAGASDLIVVSPWYLGVSFNWYYRGMTRWLTVPILEDHRVHRYDLLKTKMTSPEPLTDLGSAVRQTLAGGNRIWLVGGMHILKEDERALPLPPAPMSRYGWHNGIYVSAWSQQLAAFLQVHATSGEVIIARKPGVDDKENVPLWVVQGWRE